MTQYCSQSNGRRKLLKKLKARFDYIEAFPFLLNSATRFHQELSTIPHLDDIVTTNWDPYFERYCSAVPFVSPQDFVFWDMPGRKVFKIHGSVSSYSSLVATNEDYDRCHDQLTRGLVGSNLKMLLATKVVVFVGYSFRDHDFSRIYDFLKEEMRDALPHAYAVTLSPESADPFRSLGLSPIATDGTFFLQVLKSHLAAEGRMVPDDRFEDIDLAWYRVTKEHKALHETFSYERNPEIAYSAAYQDGLMDAFGRITQRRNGGEYSCPDHVIGLIRRYLEIQKNARHKREYADVAYIEGYVNGLQFLLLDDKQRKLLPLFYLFGYEGDLTSLNRYKRACKNSRSLHQAAYAYAKRLTKNMGDGLSFHHPPILDLSP
jgi:hypothetical protein